jgi:hypothetical protein
MCDSNTDVINTISGRIDYIVEHIGGVPCDICKRFFTDYKGECKGYSWRLSYSRPFPSGFKGRWYFGLFRHNEEIWYINSEGTITDIILAAYEGLVAKKWETDEWKKKMEH